MVADFRQAERKRHLEKNEAVRVVRLCLKLLGLLRGSTHVMDTACRQRHNGPMLDLNDLRVFERVGSLRSFAGASRDLSVPRSSVSRGVARLEAALGARLVHRTTREVELTPAGRSLMARCVRALGELDEALDYVGGLAKDAHGELRVSTGIGFGINVLADQLPAFLKQYPRVHVLLDLTSRNAELVSDHIDVAVRLGPLADSSMVAVRLGEMKRVLCASPAYLEHRAEPKAPDDLADHDIIEMPGFDGRARIWSFSRDGQTSEITIEPRVAVNDALTITRLVLNGAGVGIISSYLCASEIEAGRLVQLMPEWTAPTIEVHLIFPSKRELAPAVRAFVDFIKEANPPGLHWRNNEVPVRN